jgi:16S rRNA (guanine527-N7)-methyltransferase
MDTARIAALLQPFLRAVPNSRHSEPAKADSSDPCLSEPAKAGEEPAVLSPAQLQSISAYIDILVRWNARINLTAIRDPEEIVLRHFGESLFAASQLLNPQSSLSSVVQPFSVADVGSGAGFPGIPLKLWAPQISLTLIESNHKKATFLREVVRALTLADVNIKNVRAESLSATFNLVTLRAVEDFASILPTAAGLVTPGGRLGLLIGSAQIEPARALLPHFSWSEAVPIPDSRSRVVLAGSRPC